MKNTQVMVIFAVLFLVFSRPSFSQRDSFTKKSIDSIVKSSVEKLQQKILLTNVQSAQLEKILLNYAGEDSIATNKNTILNKIDNVLTDRQKAKFEIIKEEWWDGFAKLLKE